MQRRRTWISRTSCLGIVLNREIRLIDDEGEEEMDGKRKQCSRKQRARGKGNENRGVKRALYLTSQCLCDFQTRLEGNMWHTQGRCGFRGSCDQHDLTGTSYIGILLPCACLQPRRLRPTKQMAGTDLMPLHIDWGASPIDAHL